MPIAKILLVDGNRETRASGQDAFAWVGGPEIVTAASLAEGFSVAAHNRLDLVLVDAALPDLDVGALIARLALQQPEEPPLVFVVTDPDVSDSAVERYHRAGASAVIAKPLDHGGEQRLQAVFAEARLRRQFEHLRELGGEAFVGEMIDLFLGFAPGKIDEARRALASGQLEACRRAVHSLKAGAANLGAELVYELAGRIEQLAAENKPQPLATLLPSLEAAFGQLRTRLEQYKAVSR
jgi:HPt (histidine-containing phosphotransfer) domain-containing protein/CheY-like chemotaxis protein